ncbi:MAG: 3-phosphoshikimate 1-carboxyvinyltransferase [Anaerosomatales bacterium]|nr:3-phosphoshikimate 1-carboxyvinyltransferase [Anaerosomatales bacterium]MDT8433473.1 3-phosphoshikimate 1-carboxyvinyltransferase [Anaerosomatales bacterium]
MQYVSTTPDRPLAGELAVPGDKSLSHRAVLFAAMAEGTSRLVGVLDSEDVRASIGAVRALGASVDLVTANDRGLELVVTGWGGEGPHAPDEAIDCGNSGTTARLLLGVLAGWETGATLVGDASLSKRPMGRVTDPLASMGASFESLTGTLPITVRGGGLKGVDYVTPVASAQVKSAILLAGLQAAGRTTVREPASSRDHTELLLPAFGVPVGRDRTTRAAWVDGPVVMKASDITVPGDPSSAAFMVVAGLLVSGSRITVTGVGLNPTRIAYLDVLDRMGAGITIEPSEVAGAEPVGSVHVGYTLGLRAAVVRAAEVPALVDEIPVLALLATQAAGETRFEDVGELRVKESDRLAAVVEGLTLLGASARTEGDTLVVQGPSELRGTGLDSHGDHRLAMTWALAGLAADGPVTVAGFEAVDVSYPSFAADLAALSASG